MLIHSTEKIAPRQALQDSFEGYRWFRCACERPPGESGKASRFPRTFSSVEVTYEDIQKIQQDGTVVLVRNMVDPQRPTWHYPPALARAFADVFKLNMPSAGA